MEDLLANQQQIVEAIDQLFVNFKKDSHERKTPDYINRKLYTLDSYWQEFHNNHLQLWAFPDKSHSYFTTSTYDQTKSKYENIKATLSAYGSKAEGQGSRPSTPVLKPATILAPSYPGPSKGSDTRGTESKNDELLKKQASLVSISHGCIIKSDLFTVHAHDLDRSVIKTSADVKFKDLSPINDIINVSIPITTLVDDTFNDRQTQLTEIDKKLRDMKDQAVLATDVSYHDVHHYALIYIIIFGAIIIGACLAWRRARQSRLVAANSPATPPAENHTTVRLSSLRNSICDEENPCSGLSDHKINSVQCINRSTSPVITSSTSYFKQSS